jgi:hypothetical protein
MIDLSLFVVIMMDGACMIIDFAFTYMLGRVSAVQYAAILRFRSDLHLMRPLNLSAAVIGLGNHPSSKSSNGHFLALPCRNIGWDVTYFGTACNKSTQVLMRAHLLV